MDSQNPETFEERPIAETPEDVAVLYSWANLQGAKYRDFSASRREYRAQMRHRAAELQREAELRAKAEAETAASTAEKGAQAAEEAALFHESAARKASEERRRQESELQEAARQRAMQHAGELSRRAAAERLEAARRAEAVAAAEAAAGREAREMAEAHASAARQAARYEESEISRRVAAGPQPAALVPGQISDPYEAPEGPVLPGRLFHQPVVPEEDMRPTRLPRTREARLIVPQPDPAVAPLPEREYWATGPVDRQAGVATAGTPPIADPGATPGSPLSYYYEPDSQEKVAAVEQYAQFAPYAEPKPAVLKPVEPKAANRTAVEPQASGKPLEKRGEAQAAAVAAAEAAALASARAEAAAAARRPRGYQPDEASGIHPAFGAAAPAERVTETGSGRTPGSRTPPERAQIERVPGPVVEAAAPAAPAWISQKEDRRAPDPRTLTPVPSPVADTLQHSRERVAARWFALKGVFDHNAGDGAPEVAESPKDNRIPMVTVFSLAGGVGKTSLVATLGRALSASGEKVLLADTTSHGLLPFYFGASELRPGAVRTFSPPSGSNDAAIAMVSYDIGQKRSDAAAQEWLTDELTRDARGTQRVLLDLSPSSAWLVRRLARMNSLVVVPVGPDMNSVISLGPIEKFFAGMADAEGRPVRPFYLLNQFDASLPLHLDVREVMRQQLGERLLPFVIRRSPAVSEALAEGMTVMDYAPETQVAADYTNLAQWLRTQVAPAAAGYKNARWSER